MIKRIGKIILGISLLSIINVDKVNALEEKLLSELILGENNKNVITNAPDFSTLSTDKGLYVQEGDATKSMEGKPTYYYRGAVENNYLEFSGKTWRIVRINEDGSIKLITKEGYTNPNGWNSTGISNYINNYGTNNETDSEIKIAVELWYKNNIENNSSQNNKVITSSFCNDISDNYSGASKRLSSNTLSPIFICTNEAIIAYEKVGLITADELIYSGYPQSNQNNFSYLGSEVFRTITPANENTFFVTDYTINGIELNNPSLNFNLQYRPVINLDSKVMASGTGTKNDPYVISENLFGERSEEINNSIKENQINIKMDSNSKKDKINEIIKDNPTLYFAVEENNALPGKVTINVSGKYSDGSKLWLYKYNKDKNKIEYVKNEIEVIGGIVNINTDQTGEYFLTLNEIDSSILGEQLGINLIFIIVFLSTLLIGGAYTLIYTFRLQRNRI